MSAALSITGADLMRALLEAAGPRVDAAVRARAEKVAREVTGGDGVVTRVWRRGSGACAVEVQRLERFHADEPPP